MKSDVYWVNRKGESTIPFWGPCAADSHFRHTARWQSTLASSSFTLSSDVCIVLKALEKLKKHDPHSAPSDLEV